MNLPEEYKTQELLYIAKWLKRKSLDVIVTKRKSDVME